MSRVDLRPRKPSGPEGDGTARRHARAARPCARAAGPHARGSCVSDVFRRAHLAALLAPFRVALLAACLAILPGATAGGRLDASPASPLPPGGDFRIQTTSGSLALSDLRGRVVVLYFGYLTCPDVCPNSLRRVADALRGLTPPERKRAAGLFVSLDPERDRPENADRYASHFHPLLRGGTQTAALLAQTARRYGVSYRRVATGGALGYTVAHTSRFYVIDPAGRLARVLPHAASPAEILAALRGVLSPPVHQ